MDKHILIRMSDILADIANTNLKDIGELLDYYNRDTTTINGIMYYSFNDPCVAARLNARYYELVGEDHPRFMEQAPIVIDKLMKDKNKLLKAGAYSPLYFDKLKQIKKTIIDSLPSKQSVDYHNKNKEVLVTSSQKDDIGNASSDKELHQMFEDSYVNNITRKISK